MNNRRQMNILLAQRTMGVLLGMWVIMSLTGLGPSISAQEREILLETPRGTEHVPWHQALRVANERSATKTVDFEQPYDASIAYEGIFNSSRLYKVPSGTEHVVGSRRPALLKDVVCAEARKVLDRKGQWVGNLDERGRCGPSPEPSQWAVGNFLNYQSGRTTEQERAER